ncbi:hypothetical protein OGM63_03000 [Plectonema radiosum NIES-515]|uniref:Uncharacterized protein n=1 Tax=Plectonema radiosum NIES-515 TaxID=2986073 RepID=A0ABT3ATS0_9CYAN|nr:hypothetical protein [Plectonema radiosum]MCV3212509.1 hypothetical protein [Plectonema radiosum NIES-515]
MAQNLVGENDNVDLIFVFSCQLLAIKLTLNQVKLYRFAESMLV